MKRIQMDNYTLVITDETSYSDKDSCFSYRLIHIHGDYAMIECTQTKKCHCVSTNKLSTMKQSKVSYLEKS